MIQNYWIRKVRIENVVQNIIYHKVLAILYFYQILEVQNEHSEKLLPEVNLQVSIKVFSFDIS